MNTRLYWVTALLSSLTMATIMSGVISGYKMGFSDAWPPVWLQSFFIAWPCALLLNLTVLPQVRKLAAWICEPKKRQQSTFSLDPIAESGGIDEKTGK